MKENGLMTRRMDTESTSISMEPSTKAAGRMTSSMDLARKFGWTVQSMRAIMLRAKKMARANSDSPTALSTSGILSKTILRGTAPTLGPTEENTRANGNLIVCMEKASPFGLTAGSILESIAMTKKKVREFIFGMMAKSTMENGRTENNMEKESFINRMEITVLANGKMGKE